MTRSQGIRHVTEHQAVELLLAGGYTRPPCVECRGVGHFERPSDEMFEGMARAKSRRICEACEGAGWRWQAPVAQPNFP